MLPLLKLAGDGNEWSVKDTREPLAELFNLTEDERNEMLPSGHQSRFNNRVAWAKVGTSGNAGQSLGQSRICGSHHSEIDQRKALP